MSDLIERAELAVDNYDLYNYPVTAMVNFAQSERTRIADDLEALSQKTPRYAMVTALLEYADKLRKND